MSCFTDFITVTGACTDATSTSAYSLKDAGIMLSELNDIVTKDYTSGKALGEDKIEFARKLVSNRIHSHFADRMLSSSILDSQRIGFHSDNIPVEVGGDWRGLEIETCNQSSFISIYISQISLFVNFTGNVPVQIWDLKQNKLLDTITIAAVSGEIVTSYINKTYESDRKDIDLAFIYDSTGINSIRTQIKKGACSTCEGGTGQSTYLNSYFKARGVSILAADDKIKENLTGIGNTAGLSIVYSINCNYDAWICTVKTQLALPILYKAAEQIMEFSLHSSDRNNSRTIIDVEKNEGRMNFYANKYTETIDSILKNMHLPSDSKCFVCKQKSKTITMLP